MNRDELVFVHVGMRRRKLPGDLESYVRSVKSGSSMPISISELFDTTLATLAVNESLKTGASVDLRDLYREIE